MVKKIRHNAVGPTTLKASYDTRPGFLALQLNNILYNGDYEPEHTKPRWFVYNGKAVTFIGELYWEFKKAKWIKFEKTEEPVSFETEGLLREIRDYLEEMAIYEVTK